jgi:diacylglycerol kinase family enzyme
MSMDTVAVLFNPSSGRGKSLKKRAEIEARLTHHAIPYRWFVSRSEEHLKDLARELIRSYPLIVTVGGDTTFTLAAAEAVKLNSGVSLGMVGAGSANDICRGLGLYDLESLCAALLSGAKRPMDALQLDRAGLTDRIIFMGALSLGLGVDVNRYIARVRERFPILKRGGSTVQALTGGAAIRHAFAHNLVPTRVQLASDRRENGRHVDFSLLVIANTPYYANGLKVFPDLSPFDGRLCCGIVHSTSLLSTLKIVTKIASQRHLQHPKVEILSSSLFRISSEDPIDLQYDGEILTRTKSFEVKILPGSVNVVTAG